MRQFTGVHIVCTLRRQLGTAFNELFALGMKLDTHPRAALSGARLQRLLTDAIRKVGITDRAPVLVTA